MTLPLLVGRLCFSVDKDCLALRNIKMQLKGKFRIGGDQTPPQACIPLHLFHRECYDTVMIHNLAYHAFKVI
ncbi:hypothetical protein Ahy_A05g025660 isoform B [Arachis hypogaea]|uniref:Uncharacterized protein n=1 Tax=Arachis hypogaea TaxID=3818 RepID=A0A445D975_ARAHY|nr:hypothetical protein Ahy_A05g025660 isoform B [Arachis hypogaea]